MLYGTEFYGRTGGYLSDSICAFAESGRYLLCPRGREISILSTASGDKLGSLQGLHSCCITSVVKLNLTSRQTTDLFASVDSNSTLRIWSFVCENLRSTENLVSPFKHFNYELLQSFDITAFKSPLEEQQESKAFQYMRERICSLQSVSPSNFQNFDSSSLIIVTQSIVTSTKSLVDFSNRVSIKQHDKQEENASDPLLESSSSSSSSCDHDHPTLIDHQIRQSSKHKRLVYEVFELSSIDILQNFKVESTSTLDDNASESYETKLLDKIDNEKENQCNSVSFRWLFGCLSLTHTKRYQAKTFSVALSSSGRHIVLAIYRTLYIWDRDTSSMISSFHKEPLTSIAIHPESQFIVTGDASGRVTWWSIAKSESLGENLFKGLSLNTAKHAIKNSQIKALQATAKGYSMPSDFILQTNLFSRLSRTKNMTTGVVEFHIAIQHWHSHNVRCLNFSTDGLYLVSGGEEGVLVFWHISQTERQFVPRLRAPIHHIVVDNNSPCLAACLADNSLAFIDISTRKVKALFQSVQLPLSLVPGTSLKSLAVYVKRHDVLPITILPYSVTHPLRAVFVGSGITSDGLGPNTGLQFYDILNDRSLGFLNVNKQNFVLRERSRIHQWTIQQVAVTPDGQHIATVEYRRSIFPASLDNLVSLHKRTFLEDKFNFNTNGTDSKLETQQQLLGHESSLDKKKTNCSSTQLMNNENYSSSENITAKRKKSMHDDQTIDNINNDALSLPGEFDGRYLQSGRQYLMKFWDVKIRQQVEDTNNSSDSLQQVDLVTSIDSPHLHDVTIVTPLSRDDDQYGFDFLSASLDSTWKIWRRHHQPSFSNADSITAYICIFTGSYRPLPCLHVAISMDGSFTAISHPGCVSVWGISLSGSSTRSLLNCVGSPHGCSATKTSSTHKLSMKTRLSRVAWIESAAGTLGGERLLLTSVGSEIWIWDMRNKLPQLIWASTVTLSGAVRNPSESCIDDNDNGTVLIPDMWGLPRFSILSTTYQTLNIFEVVRGKTENIECRHIHKISVAPSVKKMQQPLLGFSYLGSAFEQYAVFLTGDLELMMYRLGFTNSENESLHSNNHNENNVTTGQSQEEDVSTTTDNTSTMSYIEDNDNLASPIHNDIGSNDSDTDGHSQRTLNLKTGKHSSKTVDPLLNKQQKGYEQESTTNDVSKNDVSVVRTNLLATYFTTIKPHFQKSSTDSKRMECIVGQTKDGLSHLAPTPSVMLRNLFSLYSPSQ